MLFVLIYPLRLWFIIAGLPILAIYQFSHKAAAIRILQLWISLDQPLTPVIDFMIPGTTA